MFKTYFSFTYYCKFTPRMINGFNIDEFKCTFNFSTTKPLPTELVKQHVEKTITETFKRAFNQTEGNTITWHE